MGYFNYPVKLFPLICIIMASKRQIMTSAYDLSGNKVIVGSGMSGLWLARLMADAGNTFCYPCNFTVDFRRICFLWMFSLPFTIKISSFRMFIMITQTIFNQYSSCCQSFIGFNVTYFTVSSCYQYLEMTTKISIVS